MYRRGVVSAVNVDTHQARVKFVDRDNVESPWLDVLVRDTLDDKEFSLPSVGAQVGCDVDDKGESGCILGAIYSGAAKPADPRNVDVRHWTFKDGGSFTYDRAAKKMTLNIPSGGELAVVVGGDVTIAPTGLVKVGDASDFVALAAKVDANFGKVVTWAVAHLHPTGVGPSGPAAPALTAQDSVACTKTKTS